MQQTLLNNIKEELEKGTNAELFVPISKEVSSAKIYITKYDEFGNILPEKEEKDVELKELDNQKYAIINFKMSLSDYAKYESNIVELNVYNTFTLQTSKNETIENKDFNFSMILYSENYYTYEIRIVNEKGTILSSQNGLNGIINGLGAPETLPKNIDLKKSYVELLSLEYLGETIILDKANNLQKVSYVGKYGSHYKYRTSLANCSITDDTLYIARDFSYKGSKGPTLFITNGLEIVETEIKKQTQTNTKTKLNFSMQGNFSGTIEATEVEKNDLIYSKVSDELKKHSSDNLYMNISNIYILEGSFEGKLKLTFNVGEQYNGKCYNVVHMKNHDYEFETFEGIVENGKIEIVVDSLSPFGIAIAETKEATNTQEPKQDDNKPTTQPEHKLDETPKTGENDIAMIISSILIIVSIAGIAIIKKF